MQFQIVSLQSYRWPNYKYCYFLHTYITKIVIIGSGYSRDRRTGFLPLDFSSTVLVSYGYWRISNEFFIRCQSEQKRIKQNIFFRQQQTENINTNYKYVANEDLGLAGWIAKTLFVRLPVFQTASESRKGWSVEGYCALWDCSIFNLYRADYCPQGSWARDNKASTSSEWRSTKKSIALNGDHARDSMIEQQ